MFSSSPIKSSGAVKRFTLYWKIRLRLIWSVIYFSLSDILSFYIAVKRYLSHKVYPLSWYFMAYGSPHMAAQKQDDQHDRTFSSYVRIQVVVLKTYLGRWTIGRSGERGSGISVLPARYDDDDDDDDDIYLDTVCHFQVPSYKKSNLLNLSSHPAF